MSEEPTKLLWSLVWNRNVDDDDEECRRLVLSGADIHAVDYDYGYTPLLFAARNNKPRVLSCLVVLGARLNHTDNYGDTAAMVAASYGNDECLSLLVSSRADLTITDKNGRTALSIAQRFNRQGCINIITRYIYI